MTIIDQKGRLFGKINLLDLVVLLVILAVAGQFGYNRFLNKDIPQATAGKDVVTVVFLVSPVREATIKQLQVTSPLTKVYDSKSNAYLGEIVAVESKPVRVLTANGVWVETDQFQHFVTVQGPGVVSEEGVTTLGGVEMRVGGEQPLRTARWKSVTLIWDLNPTPVTK